MVASIGGKRIYLWRAIDQNGEADLFLYDLHTGAKSVVMIDAAGTSTANTNGTSHSDVVISPNGRFVSFVSDAFSGFAFAARLNEH